MQRLFLLLMFCLTAVRPLTAQTPPAIPDAIADFWAQAVAQPEDFGVACMPLEHQGQTVIYNVSPFPLASVSKLLIFIEYAIRVDNGTIPLDERVSVATLDLYNLPRTDRGAHDRFMALYPPGIQTLTLWDVAAQGMMQYSSNAAADYLLARLAPVDWTPLFQSLGMFSATPPSPLTMIPLLMNNHIDGRATRDSLTALSATLGEQYLRLYVNDPVWRQNEIDYRSQPDGGRSSLWPDWSTQAAILQQATTTGSVLDFRNVMNAVYGSSSPLSPNVQYMVRTALRWNNSDEINANYVEYGAKLGFYSGGTLTLVAYGDPIHGEPVISVTFLRKIPRGTYSQFLREDSIGVFTQWVTLNACQGLYPLINGTLKPKA